MHSRVRGSPDLLYASEHKHMYMFTTGVPTYIGPIVGILVPSTSIADSVYLLHHRGTLRGALGLQWEMNYFKNQSTTGTLTGLDRLSVGNTTNTLSKKY